MSELEFSNAANGIKKEEEPDILNPEITPLNLHAGSEDPPSQGTIRKQSRFFRNPFSLIGILAFVAGLFWVVVGVREPAQPEISEPNVHSPGASTVNKLHKPNPGKPASAYPTEIAAPAQQQAEAAARRNVELEASLQREAEARCKVEDELARVKADRDTKSQLVERSPRNTVEISRQPRPISPLINPVTTPRPSFNCAKAKTLIEREICGSPTLSALGACRTFDSPRVK